MAEYRASESQNKCNHEATKTRRSTQNTRTTGSSRCFEFFASSWSRYVDRGVMRAVVQRVSSAAVTVDARTVGAIGHGLLVFVGVEREDGQPDADYVAGKIRELRVFEDPADAESSRHMNRSVQEVGGSVLVVSQFTLAGDCRKGRRPSFDRAAAPDIAKPLYEGVVRALQAAGLNVATGEFQAMMQVSLVNDGPITLLLDSRKRF